MDSIFMPPAHYSDVEDFVMQTLRTGLMLTDLLSDMLEHTPEDSFPGEDTGHVLIECLVGSIYPVVETAGVEAVRAATALLDEAGERTIAHLKLALELKQRGEA